MPIDQVKKSVAKATRKIRSHWSRDEAELRHLMAECMQDQLLSQLRYQPATVVKK